MVIYYVQSNLLCLCLLLGLYFSMLRKNSVLPLERIAYNRLLWFTALLCFSDMMAGVFRGCTFPGARLILVISNTAYFLSITMISYAWLLYVLIRVKGKSFPYRKYALILAIPLMIFAVIILTNPLTHIIFSIDENNLYKRGPGLPLHWLFSWGYLIAATVIPLVAARKGSSKAPKSTLYGLVLFIIPPAIVSVLQMFIYGISALQCGIALSVIITLFNICLRDISQDSMTGLNNRTAMKHYMNALLERGGQDLVIHMMDIDNFKKINDTLGHSAGDNILIAFSRALKDACGESRLPLFLYRFGGDEFVIIASGITQEESARLIDGIRKKADAISTSAKQGNIPLGFSIGTASGHCTSMAEVDHLLDEADHNMYHNKYGNKPN